MRSAAAAIGKLSSSNGYFEARRDKYMMQEVLKPFGLNTINQVSRHCKISIHFNKLFFVNIKSFFK